MDTLPVVNFSGYLGYEVVTYSGQFLVLPVLLVHGPLETADTVVMGVKSLKDKTL